MSEPDLRNTQIVRETAVNPTDRAVRATSVVREAAANPTDRPLRATSLVREVAVNPTDRPLWVTSIVRETLLRRHISEWNNPVPPGAGIGASDAMEVRDAINAARAFAGLDPFPWTDPVIKDGTRVRAVHFVEMRTAIGELWAVKSLGNLPPWESERYTQGGAGTGRRIYAADLRDLRWWLNYYQGLDPLPAEQGVDSHSYGANKPHQPSITGAWAQDIVNLREANPGAGINRMHVRCEVAAASGNVFDDQVKERYRATFDIYRQKGVRVFALLSPNLYVASAEVRNAWVPPQPVTPEAFTNDYITEFANRAKQAVDSFKPVGVQDFIIWNEPNVTDTSLLPRNFAALLYQCRQRITERPPFLYWGGVMFGYRTGEEPDPDAVDYVQDVYAAMKDSQLGGPDNWPWDGVNVHVFGERGPDTDRQFANIFNEVRGIMDSEEYRDPGIVLVGEWGFQVGTGSEEQIQMVFDILKSRNPPPRDPPDKPRADIMIWHSHHFFSDPSIGPWGLRHTVQAEEDNGKYVPGDETDLYDKYCPVVRRG